MSVGLDEENAKYLTGLRLSRLDYVKRCDSLFSIEITLLELNNGQANFNYSKKR